MSKIVWKYSWKFDADKNPELELPKGAKILSCSIGLLNPEELDIYALIENDINKSPKSARKKFILIQTGKALPWRHGRFVGSIPSWDVHLFEA